MGGAVGVGGCVFFSFCCLFFFWHTHFLFIINRLNPTFFPQPTNHHNNQNKGPHPRRRGGRRHPRARRRRRGVGRCGGPLPGGGQGGGRGRRRVMGAGAAAGAASVVSCFFSLQTKQNQFFTRDLDGMSVSFHICIVLSCVICVHTYVLCDRTAAEQQDAVGCVPFSSLAHPSARKKRGGTPLSHNAVLI